MGSTPEKEYVELHNHKLCLGYKMIKVDKAKIINIKQIIDDSEEEMVIESKSNKVSIKYADIIDSIEESFKVGTVRPKFPKVF